MKKGMILITFFVLVTFAFFVFNFFNQNDQLIKPQLISDAGILPSASFEKVITNALDGTKGAYAVVIKNMSNGKNYVLNQDKVFEPGSLYKLWLMGTVFEAIQKGEIKEDEILSQKIEILNKKFEIDEEETELTEGEVTMTISSALNQMITISHNYAALLLTEKVGNSKMKKFMQENGFNDSDLGKPPETVAKDIALFFEKLYIGEIVSPDSSRRMIDLLKKQQLNDGLPKYLPKDIEVAHKTGEIGYFKHDAGIVFTPKGDYIIVVLSESESPLGAQERIAEVSRVVYEYFNRQK
ncbi:MAG: serine hydrolase [Patescibacteria group bacterium]